MEQITDDNVDRLFDEWFTKELENGLTNFKFTPVEGATPKQIKKAILESERAIKDGNFKIL